MSISPEIMQQLKQDGFLINRGTENFSGRIITGNGSLSSKELAVISALASKYGNGQVLLTSRMTVEIPGIAVDTIPLFKQELLAAGMNTGGTGAKVRPIVACKGTTCTFGLVDTQALSMKIHHRFYEGWHDVALPHKFKIGVGGCPNSCIKPELNDFGIVGQRVVELSEDCKACKRCLSEEKCPMHAIAKTESGKRVINYEICNNCSRCLSSCPFGKITAQQAMYKVYLGGRWGKIKRQGTALSSLYTESEVLNVIEKTLNLYLQYGTKGERFASVVERLGIEAIEDLLHEGK